MPEQTQHLGDRYLKNLALAWQEEWTRSCSLGAVRFADGVHPPIRPKASAALQGQLSLLYELGGNYTHRIVLGRLCATLEANSPACPMSLVVGQPVVGIFPPGEPLVADEGFRISEESLSPTASVCLAR